MNTLRVVARTFLTDESGATMVEYALMIALVAAVCVVSATTFGSAVSAKFESVAGLI